MTRQSIPVATKGELLYFTLKSYNVLLYVTFAPFPANRTPPSAKSAFFYFLARHPIESHQYISLSIPDA